MMKQKGHSITEWEQLKDRVFKNPVAIESYHVINDEVVRVLGSLRLTGEMLVWDKFGKCYNFRGITFEGEEKILTRTDFYDDTDELLLEYESILKERFPYLDIIFPNES